MAWLQNKLNEDYLGTHWHVPTNVRSCATKNTRQLLIDWTKRNETKFTSVKRTRRFFSADKYDEFNVWAKNTFDIMFFISISLKNANHYFSKKKVFSIPTTLLFINVILNSKS